MFGFGRKSTLQTSPALVRDQADQMRPMLDFLRRQDVILDTSIVGYSAPNATLTKAQFGKTILATAALTAVLPANGAPRGASIRFINLTDATLSVAAATAATLIMNGHTDYDSVAFSSSGHKIGACLLCISTGTYWVAINQSDCTMTVTT